MGLRQSHSALTLPSDDAYASAAPDANQAKLIQALSSVISNVLLLQACCQARLPSRTHSPLIRIWHSRLLLTTPALPSTTAMPNYPELHVKNFSDILLLQAKASFAEIRRCALCGATPGRVSARPLSSGRRRWAAATADPCAIGCSHMEPVPIFKFILLVLRVVQRRQKQLPEAEIRHPGRHTGRVEDHKASGPWQHPSCCGRQA